MNFNYQQAASLRRLYLLRTAFQLVWAAAVFATAGPKPELAAALLVLYPLWDVACTAYDLRTSTLDAGTKLSQRINAALGVAASVGIALTAFSHATYAIGVFGAWALGAGLLQLAVGLLRRKHTGGQWAMILSGLQSTAAGVALGLGGLHGSVHASNLGGYAIFGAVYFLIAGLLLSRKLARMTGEVTLG
jgi:hypothetical protein